MKDKYDVAIEYLKENPHQIKYAWGDPYKQKGGCLFAFVDSHENSCCGCLTQIRKGTFEAQTSEFTEAIRADERIPRNYEDIQIKDLSVFAEWQRKIDKELNRS